MIELKPAPNGYLSPDDPGEPGRNAPRWSVNDTEARIVAQLCKGCYVLEIGTGLGISTRAIVKKAQEITTVDIDQFVQEKIFPDLIKEFADRIICCTELKYAFRKDVHYGAFFLDGFHEYNQVKKDIATARPLLAKGAIMIFHDLYIEGVFRGIVDSGLTPIHIQTVAGIGVCWND